MGSFMIVSKTPLRASLFGGGTDFMEYFHNSKYGYGTVISTTLNMYMYITINKRFDDKIKVVYHETELVDNVDDIKHNLIREALKLTNVTKGVEIIYSTNLPISDVGLGLASSSAVTVGTLNALHRYKKEKADKERLAKETVEIEINRLKQQIGIQDQYAVSFGGFNRYYFNDDDTVKIKPIKLTLKKKKELFDNLLLFYTGNSRDSKKIFIEQKKTIKNHSELLDKMVDITEEAEKALNEGNIDEIGRLLNKAWIIKKQFASGISNNKIDDMYNKAINSGALGGKVLGAGGGGFLLLYVRKEDQEKVKKTLSDYRQIEFATSNDGSAIVYED